MTAICKQKVNETLSVRMYVGENLRSPARALWSSIFGTCQKSKYTPTPAINGKIKTYSRISPLIEAISFPRENFSFVPRDIWKNETSEFNRGKKFNWILRLTRRRLRSQFPFNRNKQRAEVSLRWMFIRVINRFAFHDLNCTCSRVF